MKLQTTWILFAGLTSGLAVAPQCAAQKEQGRQLQSAAASGSLELAPTLQARLGLQVAAWNRGDIDDFMTVYWRSPKLSFSSGGQTTYGWEATRKRYQLRYPTREKMGQLSFSDLQITRLGPQAALVLGRWRLDRKDDEPQGNFSLVFRCMDGRWVIVHDHTSLTPQPVEKEGQP